MKNLNQEGLNELSQEEKGDINGGGILDVLKDCFGILQPPQGL